MVARLLTTAAVLVGLLLAVPALHPARLRGATPVVYPGGGVLDYGDAQAINQPLSSPLNSVMVAQAADPVSGADGATQGYWLASADGGVFAYGAAGFYGSLGSLRLNGPVVGIAATPDGKGYWLVAMDGGVFSFGDAQFYGSMGGIRLNQPVVGMAATPDGKGYWLVASDGGIFSFGDAQFYGSMGGTPLNQPIVGMAATPDGKGYWLVASDGGIFSFGDAQFYGSLGGEVLNDPIVGMAATPAGGGYLLVGSGGQVYTFGDAPFYGSDGAGYDGDPHDFPPVAALTLTPGGGGYWLLEPDGWAVDFANPPDPDPTPLTSTIVSVAAGQVRSDPDTGYFCNPYGPCEEWCALFATWVWEQAGVPIPNYAFVGDVYTWAAANTAVLPPTSTPLPGDAVLYGTGPWTVATSVHMGIVAQVWPDGAIVTVEGDAGPGQTGSLAVVMNGPYLPSLSAGYNGMPIYAFAEP